MLRNSFIELVEANDWMDSATKEVAIEKANSMIHNIGYPELIRDQTQLDKEYSLVERVKFPWKPPFAVGDPAGGQLLPVDGQGRSLDAEQGVPKTVEAI